MDIIFMFPICLILFIIINLILNKYKLYKEISVLERSLITIFIAIITYFYFIGVMFIF